MQVKINNQNFTIPTARALSAGAYIRLAEMPDPNSVYSYIAAAFELPSPDLQNSSFVGSVAQLTRYIGNMPDPMANPKAPGKHAIKFMVHLGVYPAGVKWWQFWLPEQKLPDLTKVLHRLLLENQLKSDNNIYRAGLFCLAMAARPTETDFDKLSAIAKSFELLPYSEVLPAGAFFLRRCMLGLPSAGRFLALCKAQTRIGTRRKRKPPISAG